MTTSQNFYTTLKRSATQDMGSQTIPRTTAQLTANYGQEKSIMTTLRKNKKKFLIQAYVLIMYGFLCLGYGTLSIYYVLRDDYKLFN